MNINTTTRRLFITLMATAGFMAAVAQPPRRRAERQAAESNAPAAQQSQPKGSAYRQFPTAQAMPDDAAWRRDLYLTLDLDKEKNAVLYYPATPQDGRENLFSFLFKLILRKQVKAYEYRLDGNENFSAKNEITAKKIMDDRDIFYEERDGRFRVSDADIPSDEVKAYFVKQSTYYDQHTASFRSRITAICPVLRRSALDGDYGGELAQYPLFWLKMDDIAPHLSKLMLMGSSLNNAAMMSANDYFTMGCYDGEIYKAVELKDRLLANYCPDDSAMMKEQARIEGQITALEDHVWGRDLERRRKFVADSIAAAQAAADTLDSKASRRATTRRRTATSRRTAATAEAKPAKQPRQKKVKAPSTRRSGGGLSVRRQRH